MAVDAILRAMNRIVTIALVACVILFVVAVFISPFVDIQPTALRAQQWLSLILAMFSFSLQIIVCLLPAFVGIALTSSDAQSLRRVCLMDVPCCLLC
jgi:hypothetical protein